MCVGDGWVSGSVAVRTRCWGGRKILRPTGLEDKLLGLVVGVCVVGTDGKGAKYCAPTWFVANLLARWWGVLLCSTLVRMRRTRRISVKKSKAGGGAGDSFGEICVNLGDEDDNPYFACSVVGVCGVR